MRGKKTEIWEGGHRVPCFIRWPKGGLGKPRDIGGLTQVQDILPTLMELCSISPKKTPTIDGISLVPFLKGEKTYLEEKDFTFSETGALHGPFPSPEKSNVFCIKTSTHKLIFQKDQNEWSLFDLKSDPNELNNLFGKGLSVENLLKKQLLTWIKR